MTVRGSSPAQAVREGRELVYEPWMAVLAASDPLASRSHGRIADPAGRTLPNGCPADPVELLAQANDTVDPDAEIAYRVIEDAPSVTPAVAWQEGSRSPAVAAFGRAATTVAHLV
ncbi:hypothetical protein [Cryptosporangium sp. NPDC048952]|uniref:hypothetical protein n=1 Tax=Cryptosporangium sp. NPDC048952 TaxID=3363961 RepID=UPI003714406A